jgi:hypothetical protein
MSKKKKRNGIRWTVILLLILLAGIGLLVYPTFSDWWNSLHQSRAIMSYVQTVTNLDKEEYERRYREQLDKFGENIIGVVEHFNSTGKDYILLCYEKPGDFCHRHILSAFINERLGKGNMREYIPEIHASSALF